jgi:glucose/arabinose dehydrogenase
MMFRLARLAIPFRPLLIATSMLAAAASPALAQLTLQQYATGFDNPVGMVQDPVDPTVQYVVEQKGVIRVVQNGTVLPTNFLDISGDSGPVRFANDERGLLGLAFAPDYGTSGRAYIYFTSKQGSGDSVVRRYKRSAGNPLVLDPASAFDLEFAPGQRYIPQPPGRTNHKGGKIAFGPDGYLYIGMGDGGSGGDPDNFAQRGDTLLGKMLRIDVSVGDGDSKGYSIPPDNPFLDSNPVAARPETWAFGLRNPWRFSFDTPGLGGTGGILIADVGQGDREEVNFEPTGQGGRNYGWALREGTIAFPGAGSKTPAYTPFTEPIHDYGRTLGSSISGGFVYRGADLCAAYTGRYFFTDFVSRRIWSFPLTLVGGEAQAVDPASVTEHTAELGGSGAFGNIASIDIDSFGELYLVSRSRGALYKIVLPGADCDNDTLPNTWERQFGLNPGSDAGPDGRLGDPDGDGQSNEQEFAAGTHPRNVVALSRYLAEGSSNTFFETTIGLANPGAQPAAVLLRFLRSDGTTVSRVVSVPARQHLTVRPAQIAGLETADFSTIVDTDQEVVVERTMIWSTADRFGSHSERAVNAPSTSWFFAEGATHGAFDTFYLLENPTANEALAQITYLLPNGATPIVQGVSVFPFSRRTIPLDEQSGLAETDVSARIEVTNGVGIIAERAMYRTSHGRPFNAGHASAGVTAANTNWFFAEGATGDFFDMFLLLANPAAAPTTARVRYLLPGGAQPFVKDYELGPQSRTTINVEGEDASLLSAAVAMVVEAATPIVAERAMYWPGPSGSGWQEAHNSPGTTETGTVWAIAGGEMGGANGTQTFVLIANTSNFPGQARVTVLREGATPLVEVIDLLPDSRQNVNIFDYPVFAPVANSRFGVLIESLGDTPAQIVVERATYSNDANGTLWAAGSNSLASKIQ